jgi:hypothetical protein
MESHRLLIRVHRKGELALSLEDDTEVKEVGGFVGIVPDGSRNEINGLIELADLIRHQPKQMEGLGMIWINFKDAPIERLRLSKVPGPMIRDRFIEQALQVRPLRRGPSSLFQFLLPPSFRPIHG